MFLNTNKFPVSDFNANPFRQRGVTLIELMIGLTVGALVMAGAITLFAKISFSGLENVRMVRLTEQLRSNLDLMRRDLQRAGYVDAWQAGAATVDDLGVAEMGTFGAIEINADGDCITYSYDYNENGALDDDEAFGFRLSGTEIQRKTTDPDVDCSVAWASPVTDAEVVITALSFELVQPSYEVIDDVDGAGAAIGNDDGFCDAAEDLAGGCIPNPAEVGNGNGDGTCETGETCLARRKINVVLEGRLASDVGFTVRLRDEIKVRNDRYYTMP
ncbi:MAG: hypothetical protein COA75_12010 [Cellvibrionales bacterium]|nr:MAG: hypothetical protein COA75_12010 [Cellvibrionales bacterium]